MKTPFFCIILLFLLACNSNRKEHVSSEKKQKRPTLSRNKSLKKEVPTITKNNQKDTVIHDFRKTKSVGIVSQQEGEIEWLIKQGTFVKDGDCILRLNNKFFFEQLLEKKQSLRNSLQLALDQLPNNLKKLESKWISFRNDISDTKQLTTIPKLEWQEEKNWLQAAGVLETYEVVAQAEIQMKNLFLFAKQGGEITKWYYKIGTEIKRGEKIGQIQFLYK